MCPDTVRHRWIASFPFIASGGLPSAEIAVRAVAANSPPSVQRELPPQYQNAVTSLNWSDCRYCYGLKIGRPSPLSVTAPECSGKGKGAQIAGFSAGYGIACAPSSWDP
jgi:hypothetical protein